ncbi:MAG: transglutaminase family protein [Rhodobacteraceae bacterium]|nr:transglutaminase family protein [Paracoccaceae bacterium]
MSLELPSRIAVHHSTVFEHGYGTSCCTMLTRLCPCDNRDQRLLSFSISTTPAATPIACDDSFGNRCHLFNICRATSHVHVNASSIVQTLKLPSPHELQAMTSWEELHREAGPGRFWHFLAPSKLVKPSKLLNAFIDQHGLSQKPDPFAALRGACSKLHAVLEYSPGATSVDTTASGILQAGKGVCQDFAHLMLALGRRWGVPGRYVSGYMHEHAPPPHHSVSELASHAWAEFWFPGHGWIGFDPTNDTVVDHRFVKVATGRDYTDAAPTRGVVLGGEFGTMRVNVRMESLVECETPPGSDGYNAPMDSLPWPVSNKDLPSNTSHDQ